MDIATKETTVTKETIVLHILQRIHLCMYVLSSYYVEK